MDVLIIAVIVVVVAVPGVILYKLLWRVAGPNEVLVVSRRRDAGNPELAPRSGLRVVTGRGAFVKPGVETARRLSLAPREAPLAIDCRAEADVPLSIKGVVVFKVGDDYTSIAKAAGRFLDSPERLNAEVEKVVGTNVGAIVTDMTAEAVVKDRERLGGMARDASVAAMAEMGLILISLNIQEIDVSAGQPPPQ
jgi:flotillin